MLERSAGAFTGTLVERVVEGEEALHTFSVDHAVKGSLGTTVQVRSHRDGATCGLEIAVGQRVGLFLDREGDAWTSILCQQIDPDELLAAAAPLPAPTGSGPVAVLVGGSFGDVRTVALDERGRVLAYGAGDGDVLALSVCPGSEHAVEIVGLPFEEGGGYVVDVRDLATMAITGRLGLPRDFADSYPEAIRCLDRGGAAAVVFAGDLGDGSRPDRVLRLTAGASDVVWRGSAWSASFDSRRAYLCKGAKGTRAVAVSLATGRETLLAKLPPFVGPLSREPGRALPRRRRLQLAGERRRAVPRRRRRPDDRPRSHGPTGRAVRDRRDALALSEARRLRARAQLRSHPRVQPGPAAHGPWRAARRV